MGSSDNSSVDEQYKDICARIGCRNRPTVSLIIKYVDKKGRFCKSCGDDIIRLGLAEPLRLTTTNAVETAEKFR
jgi:hypothetical protein